MALKKVEDGGEKNVHENGQFFSGSKTVRSWNGQSSSYGAWWNASGDKNTDAMDEREREDR